VRGKGLGKVSERPVVALVEDDPVLGASLVQRLALEGIVACWWRSAGEARRQARRVRPQAVVCDIRLPDDDGERLFAELTALLGPIPFLFVTGYGSIDQAVRLVRAGAADYLTKPFAVDELIGRLHELLARSAPATGELGPSRAMREVEAVLRRVAQVDSHVLITGESGVGKEVCARFLHACSPRSGEPFLAVNCAALPRDLAESELFGHEAGAFTGAQRRHAGHLERAGAGTLLLDEIGELPLELQAKLLRVLEEHVFWRLGGERMLALRARVVCATNRDLEAEVAAGRFRADLFYRINVIRIEIPPLRERPEDVPWLLDLYLARVRRRLGVTIEGFTPAAEAAALAWHWPGNVRELVNRVERAAVLARGPRLDVADLFPEWTEGPCALRGGALAEVRDAAERVRIEQVLAECGGRTGEAARRLGISRTTLWEKMRRLGLSRSGGAR